VSFGCCRTTARFTRLTYFSYSHNVAVHVHMKDSTILEASRAEGYLPPKAPGTSNGASSWLAPTAVSPTRCKGCKDTGC